MKFVLDIAIGTATLPFWLATMAWTAYSMREPPPMPSRRRLLGLG
jgi:hypothetical protein